MKINTVEFGIVARLYFHDLAHLQMMHFLDASTVQFDSRVAEQACGISIILHVTQIMSFYRADRISSTWRGQGTRRERGDLEIAQDPETARQ